MNNKVDYLINELIKENIKYKDIEIPKNYDDKVILLRSLMNVREPKVASKKFLEVQDAFLQEQAKEKGIGYLVAINDSQEVYGENDLFIQQVGYRKEPTTYILDKEFDYKQVDNFYKIYLALDEKEEASFKNKDQLGSL